jgi:hypothetical protein
MIARAGAVTAVNLTADQAAGHPLVVEQLMRSRNLLVCLFWVSFATPLFRVMTRVVAFSELL